MQSDSNQGGETAALLHALWRIEHALQRASKRMSKDHGLTAQQHLVIRLLGREKSRGHDFMSAGALTSELRVHPSTLTPVLKALEQAKLVIRTPDPDDTRRARLSLSGEGARLDQTLPGSVEGTLAEALRSMPNLNACQQTLQLLADALDSAHDREASQAEAVH